MELAMSLPYILAALMGAYVFIFCFLKKLNEWYHVGKLSKHVKKSLPPGDMGWPLIGNLIPFLRAYKSRDPDSFTFNLITRYGRTGIYKTFIFGSPSVIVCSPETCRRVLTDDENFKLGYPAATQILTGRKSFHTLSNVKHKRLRKLTTAPITGHEALGNYIEYIENIIAPSFKEWSSIGRPFEFLTEMRKVAFRVITHIFFGPGTDFVVEKMEKLYKQYTVGMKGSAINLPGFPFHKSLKARKELVNICQGILDEERKAMENGVQVAKKNLVQLLIETTDEDGSKLDDEDIIDLLIVFMLAGHESSAHGTMWAMSFLSSNPEVLKRAREEQEEIIKRRLPGQNGLTLDEVKSMHYLQKVIDETLRRASLSFAVFRQAKADVEINGYMVPKGWKVLVWFRAVHMDSMIHSNPKEFNPSRFESVKSKAGALLPFGGGPRYCPGSDLAKMEISIFLHHLLFGYKFERVNPDCGITYMPVPRPKDNCLATLTKL